MCLHFQKSLGVGEDLLVIVVKLSKSVDYVYNRIIKNFQSSILILKYLHNLSTKVRSHNFYDTTDTKIFFLEKKKYTKQN